MKCAIFYFTIFKLDEKYCSRKTTTSSEFIIILVENEDLGWVVLAEKFVPNIFAG
jgi:hypothetical protein